MGAFLLLAEIAGAAGPAVAPPAPFGPIPSERQQKWHEMEFYGFLHFTVNTFTDKEWGYGDESPSVFHPSRPTGRFTPPMIPEMAGTSSFMAG